MIPSRRHLVLATLLFVPGCGSTPSEQARSGRVEIVLDDYRFRPQRITARPGVLRFALRNEGRIAHNLVIRRYNRNLRRADTLKPDKSIEVSLRVRPGLYRLYCSLSNHEVLGMYGTLRVRR